MATEIARESRRREKREKQGSLLSRDPPDDVGFHPRTL